MFYQVLVQTPHGWQPRGALESSHTQVVERLRRAAREGEPVLLSSRTVVDLAAMAERVQRGQVQRVVGIPLPSCPADLRRWEIEAGPGGDRDRPYAFDLSGPWEVTRHWIALMRRRPAERDR